MSRIIDMRISPAVALNAAVSELEAGSLVIIPTETVYGIAALPKKERAVEAIFQLKGRSAHKAITLLTTDIVQASSLVKSELIFDQLADAFWPGPLTIVTYRASGLDFRLGGDEETIGVRCPDHDLVRSLTSTLGPLAVTSANLSGQPTEVSADLAAAAVGNDLLVIDGGLCTGTPSTVINLTKNPACLLRSGSISREDLLTVGLTLAEG